VQRTTRYAASTVHRVVRQRAVASVRQRPSRRGSVGASSGHDAHAAGASAVSRHCAATVFDGARGAVRQRIDDCARARRNGASQVRPTAAANTSGRRCAIGAATAMRVLALNVCQAALPRSPRWNCCCARGCDTASNTRHSLPPMVRIRCGPGAWLVRTTIRSAGAIANAPSGAAQAHKQRPRRDGYAPPQVVVTGCTGVRRDDATHRSIRRSMSAVGVRKFARLSLIQRRPKSRRVFLRDRNLARARRAAQRNEPASAFRARLRLLPRRAVRCARSSLLRDALSRRRRCGQNLCTAAAAIVRVAAFV